jgi:hypothetical protein
LKAAVDNTNLIPNCCSPKAPVAYIVFNRPRHTRETFAAIRNYRPSQLFIIADAPRRGHPGDIERCREVKSIVSAIDWPCEVFRNFSESNLGAGARVSSGLDWVFSKVDRAIVLEDDCLASPEFFTLCEALLEWYQDCESVWCINGNSYQAQFQRGEGSYFFSRFPDPWGWATWRRAWRHFQRDLPFLEEWQRSKRWKTTFRKSSERRYFRRIFEEALSGAVDAWDYQWIGCVLYGGGICAVPNANLVNNIGLDEQATHTKTASSWNYDITELGNLVHPATITVDIEADAYYRHVFLSDPLARRIARKCQHAIAAVWKALP